MKISDVTFTQLHKIKSIQVLKSDTVAVVYDGDVHATILQGALGSLLERLENKKILKVMRVNYDGDITAEFRVYVLVDNIVSIDRVYGRTGITIRFNDNTVIDIKEDMPELFGCLTK